MISPVFTSWYVMRVGASHLNFLLVAAYLLDIGEANARISG
jgi:hypothetical protein